MTVRERFDKVRKEQRNRFSLRTRLTVLVTLEMLACVLCARLRERYSALLCARYKLKPEEFEDLQDFELAELIGKKRGFLISRGEVDFLRTSNMLLDEFRGGKIGRITLDMPNASEV